MPPTPPPAPAVARGPAGGAGERRLWSRSSLDAGFRLWRRGRLAVRVWDEVVGLPQWTRPRAGRPGACESDAQGPGRVHVSSPVWRTQEDHRGPRRGHSRGTVTGSAAAGLRPWYEGRGTGLRSEAMATHWAPGSEAAGGASGVREALASGRDQDRVPGGRGRGRGGVRGRQDHGRGGVRCRQGRGRGGVNSGRDCG